MSGFHKLHDEDGDGFTLDLHDGILGGWVEIVVAHESGCIVLNEEKALNIAKLINDHFGVKS